MDTTEITPGKEHYFFNISLKLIMENDKGEFLALKNPDTSILAGFYDLPGGRINENEIRASYAEIIAREIEEELGADIEYDFDPRPVGTGRTVYFSRHLGRENCTFMVMFRAKFKGGIIRISEEHCAYKWLDPAAESMSDYFTEGFLDGVEDYLVWKDA
jgi:8-oxo-dGTP pyrophosphatase MutT (NUDIX family)